MNRGILIGTLLICLTITGFYHYTQNKRSVSDMIEDAVVDYLDQGVEAEFLKEEDLYKLNQFKEKFEQENFLHYETQAFKPDNDSKVYLMLKVEPKKSGPRGIVLYMTFDLKKEDPVEIKQLIISNWVVIEYEAKQF